MRNFRGVQFLIVLRDFNRRVARTFLVSRADMDLMGKRDDSPVLEADFELRQVLGFDAELREFLVLGQH